jgi:Spy/CpxP family protein refolding chaperone
MRRFIISAIALSLAAAPTVLEAQGTPRAERAPHGARAGGIGNPAERVLQHREELGLTLDQVRQLQQQQAHYAERNQPLLDQLREVRPAMGIRAGALTPEQRAEMRGRMQGIRGGARTPEQRAEMRERMQGMRGGALTPEQRAEMRERMQGMRGGALTPEQRAEMPERMQGMRGGARQATPEARAQFEALRPVLEELRANHAQAREQAQAVLTAAQTARLQELMNRRGEGRSRGEGLRRGAGPRR